MTETHMPTKDDLATTIPPGVPGPEQQRTLFWRHFWQMLAAMAAGMIAAGAIFVAVVSAKTWEEVTTQYPTQVLLAMAVGMTVPMAAWMLYAGMSRRSTGEMSAVMLVTVIPFLCLVWFDATKSAQCGGYCALSILGMLALMRYRYAEYANPGMCAHRPHLGR